MLMTKGAFNYLNFSPGGFDFSVDSAGIVDAPKLRDRNVLNLLKVGIQQFVEGISGSAATVPFANVDQIRIGQHGAGGFIGPIALVAGPGHEHGMIRIFGDSGVAFELLDLSELLGKPVAVLPTFWWSGISGDDGNLRILDQLVQVGSAAAYGDHWGV